MPRIGQARAPLEQVPAHTESDEFVTVVTGLPRSGTSMMMQMLQAAGLDPLADELRQPDADNPLGYFELKAATQLRDDPSWVAGAGGRAVKVVAQLLTHLPQGFRYRALFMQRDIDEILASQRAMLERHGKQGSTLADTRMKRVFERQLAEARQLLNRHNIPTLLVPYTGAIEKPGEAAVRVAEFLGPDVDAHAMAAAIAPALHRQRRDRMAVVPDA